MTKTLPPGVRFGNTSTFAFCFSQDGKNAAGLGLFFLGVSSNEASNFRMNFLEASAILERKSKGLIKWRIGNKGVQVDGRYWYFPDSTTAGSVYECEVSIYRDSVKMVSLEVL